MLAHTLTQTHAHTQPHARAEIHIHTNTQTYTQIQAYTHAHACTYIHTLTYAHTLACTPHKLNKHSVCMHTYAYMYKKTKTENDVIFIILEMVQSIDY